MPNRQRGELEVVLGGKKWILCLTLGALAELEAKLSDQDIISFTDRLSDGHIKASDLIYLFGAALRGGGNEISDEEMAGLMPEGGFVEAVHIAAHLIALAFGGADALKDKKKQIYQTPQIPQTAQSPQTLETLETPETPSHGET